MMGDWEIRKRDSEKGEGEIGVPDGGDEENDRRSGVGGGREEETVG